MLCECGCGAETGVYTNSSRGHRKGMPRYIRKRNSILEGDSVSEQIEYTIRVEGTANSYGLGKTIVPNVAFFERGCWGLTWDELQNKLKALGKAVLR